MPLFLYSAPVANPSSQIRCKSDIENLFCLYEYVMKQTLNISGQHQDDVNETTRALITGTGFSKSQGLWDKFTICLGNRNTADQKWEIDYTCINNEILILVTQYDNTFNCVVQNIKVWDIQLIQIVTRPTVFIKSTILQKYDSILIVYISGSKIELPSQSFLTLLDDFLNKLRVQI